MNELSHNRIINRHPPPITKNERQLPRATRTILALLRSIWAHMLNSCPSCNQAAHDSMHLISCPAKPTILKPIDKWLTQWRLLHIYPTNNISTSNPFQFHQISIKSQEINMHKLIILYLQGNSSRGNSRTVTITLTTFFSFYNRFTKLLKLAKKKQSTSIIDPCRAATSMYSIFERLLCVLALLRCVYCVYDLSYVFC